MNSGTTTGLLAELRQQDLLREAASGRLVPAGTTALIGRRSAAQIRHWLVSPTLRIFRPASAAARRGPRSEPDHLRRAPGRA